MKCFECENELNDYPCFFEAKYYCNSCVPNEYFNPFYEEATA